jgi:hypothetical protein
MSQLALIVLSYYGHIVSSLEEFLRGFATFGMIVHVIEYIVHKA